MPNAQNEPGGRLLILPDEMPVTEGHLLVATPDDGTFYSLPPERQNKIVQATLIVARRMTEEYRPKRPAGLFHFGAGVDHPHWHVVQRNQRADGRTFFEDEPRPRATLEQLAQARNRLLNPGTDGERRAYTSLAGELYHSLGYVAYAA